MQDRAFNMGTESVDSTPATSFFGDHSAAPFPWSWSFRRHAQSRSELVCFPECFCDGIEQDRRMAFVAAMSSRKSSGFQVEALGYSTVTEYVVSYLQLR